MSKEALELLIESLEKWSIVFGVIVALGVTGEAVVAVRLFRSNKTLHDILQAEAKAKDGQIADLQLQVEQARKENLALEKRLAPRRLSREDVSEFLTVAAPYVGQKFRITWPVGDMEAAGFAAQLIRMILPAGWVNVDDNQAMPRSYEGERILIGVRVLPGIDEKSKEACDFLLNWLHSKRIGAFPVLPRESLGGLPTDDVMEIRVGVKVSTLMDNKHGIR